MKLMKMPGNRFFRAFEAVNVSSKMKFLEREIYFWKESYLELK